MIVNHPIQHEEDARPRVIVSVIATVDGRVTLSRPERLLDEDSSRRWRAAWPADVDDLLAQRTAAIERRHHPTVVGDERTGLLVITCRNTPAPYLANLRRESIPYLVAGIDRVDLRAALLKIRLRLGAESLVSEAGGGLNGALLRAGLVDELHVITIPALVGGLGPPSIMDGPPLQRGSIPVRLQAVDVKVGTHGTTWTQYQIHRGGA